jgi:hypothetical protein
LFNERPTAVTKNIAADKCSNSVLEDFILIALDNELKILLLPLTTLWPLSKNTPFLFSVYSSIKGHE